jgi:plastocyanin
MKVKVFFAAMLLGLASTAMAGSSLQYELTITNHQFEPSELVVPAQTKIQLVVHNKDNLPEEFESNSLHVEKIIGPNQSGIVNVGPLSAGEYEFYGEIHSDTARGRIVVQ